MSTRRATSIPHPKAASIEEMPLEDFYTSAFCLDLSHVPLKHEITVAEMEAALAASGESIRKGDTVLINMGVNKRLWGTPGYATDFPGLHVDSVHWLADKGVKIFGVEAVSPAPQGEPNFKAHLACARARHHAHRVPVESGGRGGEGALHVHRLPAAHPRRHGEPDPRGRDVRGVNGAAEFSVSIVKQPCVIARLWWRAAAPWCPLAASEGSGAPTGAGAERRTP